MEAGSDAGPTDSCIWRRSDVCCGASSELKMEIPVYIEKKHYNEY